MAEVEVLQRPTARVPVNSLDREGIITYRDQCAALGIVNPEIVIEDFKFFLNEADMPVFDLTGVVDYMDKLTAYDNPSKLGWEWLPVRASDRIGYEFGRPAKFDYASPRREALLRWHAEMLKPPRSGFFGRLHPSSPAPSIGITQPVITPASDYHAGSQATVYDRAIPMHALNKMAKVEKEFGPGRVAFMITDYVTDAHIVIRPDPFLMAVVPNKELGKGVGRFVIDVWDEPGFGIAQMLK